MSVSKVTVALISCAVFSAQAQTANVAQDFSIGSNPGGAWSYGWASSLGQSFGLNLFNWAFGAGSNVALGWSAANPANVSDANPSVLYLLNGTAQLFSYSTISAPSGSVNLHPGPAGELAVVRWTAPTAGTYLVSGAFRGNDVLGTTTDVHICVTARPSWMARWTVRARCRRSRKRSRWQPAIAWISRWALAATGSSMIPPGSAPSSPLFPNRRATH